MKKHPPVAEGDINSLCGSCRRGCKQPANLVIASCPRYYAGIKPEKRSWRQPDLPFSTGSKNHSGELKSSS